MAQRRGRRSHPRLSRRAPVASLRDHHIRRLDHRERIIADFKGEVVDGLVGDRRGDDHPAADVDTDMRGRLTFGYCDDLALELVAGAELHHDLLSCTGRYPIGYHTTSANQQSDDGMASLGAGGIVFMPQSEPARMTRGSKRDLGMGA